MIRRLLEGVVKELFRPLLRQLWKELRVEILTRAARSKNEIDDKIADAIVTAVDKVLRFDLNNHRP